MSIEVNRARALDGVAHGFLGRRGGVSTGVTAGLDLGRRGQVEIGPELAENRRRAVEAVLPECVTLSMPWPDAERPHADAMVTDRPGYALGILTADCAPVLLADREAGVVGAAHAGWKGAIGGVTDSTVAAMEKLGARRDRIVAAIGPCIARASYEVDDAFQRRFEADDPENERFFAAGREGHAKFDLEAYVAHRLAAAGVRTVEMMGLDTYSDADRFYSFRRATHRGEPDYGRLISIIGI